MTIVCPNSNYKETPPQILIVFKSKQSEMEAESWDFRGAQEQLFGSDGISQVAGSNGEHGQ